MAAAQVAARPTATAALQRPVAHASVASCRRGGTATAAAANAWRQCWRPAAPQPRRRSSAGGRCEAKAKGSDVGRVLRDALQQPAQGQNLAYLAGGNFLRELGIENSAEANRILDIAMNPNSLYALNNRKQPTNPHARRLDVEADLKPVVEFLQARGLSHEQIVKAITVHPPLLCYSVPDRLQPFFAYLSGPQLGLSAAEAASVVDRRPSLVGVEVGQLERMVGYLLESGTSREELTELLSTTL